MHSVGQKWCETSEVGVTQRILTEGDDHLRITVFVRAREIEQLERDEFVIDCKRRDKIEDEGEQECEEIRKEAEKTNLRLELLQ